MIRPAGVVLLGGLAAMIGLFVYALVEAPEPGQIPSALIGKPAPDFSLPALEGAGTEALVHSDLADGTVHLVNFWASWCLPCQVEHPLLMKLAQRSDIRLVGIVYKDQPAKALAVLRERGNPYARIAQDLDGRAAIDWGASGVPETFVVDGQGTILARLAGPVTERNLRRTLEPAIAQARRP